MKATKKNATKKKATKKKATKKKATKKKVAKKRRPQLAAKAPKKPKVPSLDEIVLDDSPITPVTNPFDLTSNSQSSNETIRFASDDIELEDDTSTEEAEFESIDDMISNDIETDSDLMDEPEVDSLIELDDVTDQLDDDEEGYF